MLATSGATDAESFIGLKGGGSCQSERIEGRKSSAMGNEEQRGKEKGG